MQSPTQTSTDLQSPTRVFSPAPLEMLQLSRKHYPSCSQDYSKFGIKNPILFGTTANLIQVSKIQGALSANLATSLPFNKHK